MILDAFFQLLPILILAGGGVLLDYLYDISLDTLIKIITDFLLPMLIFYSLYTSDISAALVIDIAGSVTFIIISLAVLSFAYVKLFRIEAGAFIPPILFMNSGFLGIPLMKLWGGIPAMNLIVIFDQIATIFIFTLGILLVTGGFTAKSLLSVVKSPVLWALIFGFAFRFLQIPFPGPVLTALEFGGNAAPPLAAVALGVSLGETKMHISRNLAAGLILRFLAGFFTGFLAAELFGLTGIARTVVIVAAALPSAVFTTILPLRYGVRADFAGTMVVISTLFGIITIPLSFWLAAL